jgi:transporter family protein
MSVEFEPYISSCLFSLPHAAQIAWRRLRRLHMTSESDEKRFRVMLIHSWLFWALLSATFAALTVILAKFGLKRSDPDVAQLLHTAVALVAIAIPVALSGKLHDMAQWNGRTWVYFVFAGLATAASWICYFRALDIGDPTRVAAVDKLSVAMVAVAAVVLLHERLGISGWCGIGLVTAGLIMIGRGR